VARTRRPRGAHPRGAVLEGTCRQEGQVCLVLDLLDPGERQEGPGVLEEEEAPEFGKELRAGSVASIEGDVEAMACLLGSHEGGDAPDLSGRGAHVIRRHTQLGQLLTDLGRRGQPEWRAEREVHCSGRAPPESQACQHIEEQRVTTDQRCDGRDGDRQLDETTQRAREVREGHAGDGDGDGDANHRDPEPKAAERGIRRALALGPSSS